MKFNFDKVFTKFSTRTACWMGKPWAFLLATLSVLVWAVSGPFFGYSDTWELIINTATTIVTFLMVFLIQNTQNRDNHALQLKLNELIFAIKKADNKMIDIEELGEEELEAIAGKYRKFGSEVPTVVERKLEDKKKEKTSSVKEAYGV